MSRARRERSEAGLLKRQTLENSRVVFYSEDGFENRLRQLSHELHLEAGKSRSLGLRGELSCKIAGQRSGRLRVLSVLINYNPISRSTLFTIAHTPAIAALVLPLA